MFRSIKCLCQVISLVVLFFGIANAEENKPIDILRLPGTKLERVATLARDDANIRALTDGNPATVAKIEAPGVAVDLVYGFGAELVTAERLSSRCRRKHRRTRPRYESRYSSQRLPPSRASIPCGPIRSSQPVNAQEFSFAPIALAGSCCVLRPRPRPSSSRLRMLRSLVIQARPSAIMPSRKRRRRPWMSWPD